MEFTQRDGGTLGILLEIEIFMRFDSRRIIIRML